MKRKPQAKRAVVVPDLYKVQFHDGVDQWLDSGNASGEYLTAARASMAVHEHGNSYRRYRILCVRTTQAGRVFKPKR